MNKMIGTVVAAGLAVALSAGVALAQEKNVAQLHMGHVLTGWKDTPDKAGLLPTAVAEAKIAIQHAGFSMQKPANLDWLKAHVGHVLHAVDPKVMPKGPGLGYGVIRAAKGAVAHIGFSTKSTGATKNIKVHAVHVSASAGNVVAWGQEIVALGQRVQASNSVDEAAQLAAEIEILAHQLIDGVDLNNDGSVTWHKGEGGLGQAGAHMGFMKKGDGMS